MEFKLTTQQQQQQQHYILQLIHLNNLSYAYSTSNQLNPVINLLQFHTNSNQIHESTQLKVTHNLGSVSQLNYSPHHSLLLAAFSNHPTLLGWDLRQHHHPTIQLNGASNSPFKCLDYSPQTQLLVAASTNEADSSETQIHLFDLRGTCRQPMCIYDQAHSDSITNLKFHPSSHHTLLSASVDGLLILHDTRIHDQDESILSIGNVGASVATVRFSPHQNSIWCGTDMETLSLWDSNQLTLVKNFGDLRRECWAYPNSNWTEPVSYLINLSNPSAISPTSQSAYFAGSQSGNVVLVDTSDIQGDNWNVITSLEGGHTEMVRCAAIDEQHGLILTGGEDGQICLWSKLENQNLSLQLESNHFASLSPQSCLPNSNKPQKSVGSKPKRFHPY